MWCNSYAITVNDLKTTTWTFGGEGSTGVINFDLSAVSCRLFYGVVLEEINFKNNCVIKDCNNTNSDNASFFRADTINVYDGAKIVGNYTQPYRGFMNVSTLNIYGGEIYGNYFNEYGMVIHHASGKTPVVNMYGGSIHDIYLAFSNSGVTEGLFNNSTFNMYGGEIYNVFVKGTSTSRHSALAGSKSLIESSVRNLYYFSSWTAPTRVDGVYTADLDLSTASEITTFLGGTSYISHSVIFKNADSSVIDAFMIKSDGSIHKSLSGATVFSAPTTFDFWKTSVTASCATAVDASSITSASGATYYGSAHSLGGEKIIYPNGFGASGHIGKACEGEGCAYSLVITDGLEPIIIPLGYSFREDTSRGFGISGGYKVNHDAIEAYELANGVALNLGVIMLNPEFATADSFFANGNLAVSDKAIQVSASSGKYATLSFMICGFDNTMLDLDLVISSYVNEVDSKGTKTSFVQRVPVSISDERTFEKADATLYSVSYNSLSGLE